MKSQILQGSKSLELEFRVNMSLPLVIWASSGLPSCKNKSLDSNLVI